MNDVTKTSVSNEAVAPAPAKQDLDVFLGAPAQKPWYKRPLYIVGIIVVLGLLLLLSRCFMGTAEGGYATETVRRGRLTVTVSATGNLQPTNEVQVGSEQSGLVTQVFVDNNDRVVQGQPLARLDTARLQDTIVQAQAGLASAQAQVATAQASAAQARANLARQEEVFRVSGGRVPSRTELDAARAENARAVAGVRAAKAQVETGPRAAVLGADQFVQGDHLFAGHRRRALAPDRSGADRRRLLPGADPVHHRRGSSAMKLEVRVDEADVGAGP